MTARSGLRSLLLGAQVLAVVVAGVAAAPAARRRSGPWGPREPARAPPSWSPGCSGGPPGGGGRGRARARRGAGAAVGPRAGRRRPSAPTCGRPPRCCAPGSVPASAAARRRQGPWRPGPCPGTGAPVPLALAAPGRSRSGWPSSSTATRCSSGPRRSAPGPRGRAGHPRDGRQPARPGGAALRAGPHRRLVPRGGDHRRRRGGPAAGDPDDTPAVVDVEVLTADGRVDQPPGRGIAVGPRARTAVPLDRLAPDRDLLAVHVPAVRGRLAGGVRHVRTSGPAPRGVDWVPPAGAPAAASSSPASPPARAAAPCSSRTRARRTPSCR